MKLTEVRGPAAGQSSLTTAAAFAGRGVVGGVGCHFSCCYFSCRRRCPCELGRFVALVWAIVYEVSAAAVFHVAVMYFLFLLVSYRLLCVSVFRCTAVLVCCV